MTVRESIICVLKQNTDKKLNAKEITNFIVSTKLYLFKNARDPKKVVGSELSKMIKKNDGSLCVDRDTRPFLYILTKEKT